MTALADMTPAQLAAAETTLRRGTWAITAGAVLFSVLTVTPLVERVTPAEWQWTAPILPVVVDTAVVIVVRLDSTVSRLGGSTGGWPAVLRWMTGLFTLLLNVGDSALKSDLVGVAVHAVAPLLLIVTAEAGLAYRRKIAVQLEQLERSRREQEECSRREQETRRERERQQREHAEREAREHAERLERERAEREAAQRREEREHAAQLERERAEREAAARREEREEAERIRREEQQRQDRARAEQLERERQERERADRERREQLERERAEQAVREQREREAREARERAAAARREQSTPRAVNSGERPALTAVPVNDDRPVKMAEADARTYIASFLPGQKSVRELAHETGWSVGWVAERLKETRTQRGASIVPAAAGGAR